MTPSDDRAAVVKELYNRRESLDPDKRAVVEELAKRMNLSGASEAPSRSDQIMAASSTITPEDTLMPRANKWLKENHPKIYGAIESLLTAIPRGSAQVARAADSGQSISDRISDVIEGTSTALSPTLLAVPGSGHVAQVATGLVGSQIGKGIGEVGAEAFGADPDTRRMVGNLGAVAGGVAGAAVEPKWAQAAQAVKRVITNPKIIRAGVKVLPKGSAMVDLVHEIKAAMETEQPVAAPSAPAAPASSVQSVEVSSPENMTPPIVSRETIEPWKPEGPKTTPPKGVSPAVWANVETLGPRVRKSLLERHYGRPFMLEEVGGVTESTPEIPPGLKPSDPALGKFPVKQVAEYLLKRATTPTEIPSTSVELGQSANSLPAKAQAAAEAFRDALAEDTGKPAGTALKIPAPEPGFKPEHVEAVKREAKTTNLSDVLHEHGVTYEQARGMDKAQWKLATDAANSKKIQAWIDGGKVGRKPDVHAPPSSASIGQALFKLLRLEKRSAAANALGNLGTEPPQ